MDLSQQKIGVWHGNSLDISPWLAKLSQKLFSTSGIGSDISLGGIRALQEARMVNLKVMAMEASFMHKLWEK